jgi:hypothetical protein
MVSTTAIGRIYRKRSRLGPSLGPGPDPGPRSHRRLEPQGREELRRKSQPAGLAIAVAGWGRPALRAVIVPIPSRAQWYAWPCCEAGEVVSTAGLRPAPVVAPSQLVYRRQRLCGMLSYYHRAVA